MNTNDTSTTLDKTDLSLIHLALEARVWLYREDGMTDLADAAETLARTFARLHAKAVYGDTVTITASAD